MSTMKGRVTRIYRNEAGRKDKGGYFFVKGDDDTQDRFAHANDIGQEAFSKLREEQRVEFTPLRVTLGKGNGLRAENVKIIE